VAILLIIANMFLATRFRTLDSDAFGILVTFILIPQGLILGSTLEKWLFKRTDIPTNKVINISSGISLLPVPSFCITLFYIQGYKGWVSWIFILFPLSGFLAGDSRQSYVAKKELERREIRKSLKKKGDKSKKP
jgi:hypothetical protein